MSVQPVRQVNRVDFVVVIVTGVLLEISLVPLLPVKLLPVPNNVPQISISGLSFWLVLFSALVVAYTAGRLINVVTMELWRRDTIPRTDRELCEGRNFLLAKPHRTVFVDELESPSLLDERLVCVFKTRVSNTFEKERPFSGAQAEEVDDESEDDDSDCEHTFLQVDHESLWPFVLSYVRIHGGDFVIYLQTVFRFTRNSTVLFFGLYILYAWAGILSRVGVHPADTLYTSQEPTVRFLVPVALLAITVLFWFGVIRNRDDYVTYIVSDFVSLRAAEDE